MLIFEPEELRDDIRRSIKYLKDNQTGNNGIEIDFYNIDAEDFNEDLYANRIDEDFEIGITLDNCDEVRMTTREFIDMVNEVMTVNYHDKSMCISNKTALVRITECSHEDFTVADALLEIEEEIFTTQAIIDNQLVSISIIKEFSLFAVMNHFKEYYGGYFESFTNLDRFVKVSFDDQLDKENILKIVYSYLFELSASHNMNFMLEEFYYEEKFEEPEIDLPTNFILRPLIFGKGTNNILTMYNEAIRSVNNPEYSIIQFSKILEYISQTIVRNDINEKVLAKLSSNRALDPDANYIQELERIFNEMSKKYDSDRNSIKSTIETCCDLYEIVDIAPKYMTKVKKINELSEKANKDKVLEAAYEEVANSISDTRNYLSHAKSNYIKKGNECPVDQFMSFSDMLRILVIQSIRWFDRVHENSRVI